MKKACIRLAVGIGAITAIMLGGIGGGGAALAQEPDYSGIGDVIDFSGLDGLENLAPPPVDEPAAAEPPAAAIEEPAPAIADVAPAPAAPVITARDVVALPSTGGGENSTASTTSLLLYAAALAVLGAFVVATAKRRA